MRTANRCRASSTSEEISVNLTVVAEQGYVHWKTLEIDVPTSGCKISAAGAPVVVEHLYT